VIPLLAAAAALVIRAGDFYFAAPDTVAAGAVAVELRNTGLETHQVTFVKLGGGHTMAEAFAILGKGGPEPAWLEYVSGPFAPAGRSVRATMTLEPGSYALLCFVHSPDHVRHMAKGMMRALTVRPPAAAYAAAPPADLTVTLSDFAFAFDGRLIAGTQAIRLRNIAQQSHEMVIARLAPGQSAADLVAWLLAHRAPPPGLVTGVTSLSAGHEIVLRAELTPGEYAIVCLLTDATDGRPHYVHGMVRQVSVRD
jgi:plastocyanin